MKQLKVIAIVLAVVLVAGVAVFYSCAKEGNVASSLEKETEFVAKIHETLCVRVDVFRDENNHAHITTQRATTDPELPIGVVVPEALNIEPRQAKDDESMEIEIPGDAIYWLVPLDGNEPVKFEPVNNTKAQVGGPTITVTCICNMTVPNCSGDKKCEPPYTKTDKNRVMTIYCVPELTSCCAACEAKVGSSTGAVIPGSSYLVRSESVTVNDVTYR